MERYDERNQNEEECNEVTIIIFIVTFETLNMMVSQSQVKTQHS